MSRDPDPFEQGQRAARENIPAEANPYQDGSEQHALWVAGHEQVAALAENPFLPLILQQRADEVIE